MQEWAWESVLELGSALERVLEPDWEQVSGLALAQARNPPARLIARELQPKKLPGFSCLTCFGDVADILASLFRRVKAFSGWLPLMSEGDVAEHPGAISNMLRPDLVPKLRALLAKFDKVLDR